MRGETGELLTIENGIQTTETKVPDLPAGASKADATTIHSHPTTVQVEGTTAYPQTTTNPSDADKSTFGSYCTNIIVGNTSQPSLSIGTDGKVSVGNATRGASIYQGGSTKPRTTLKRSTIKKIIHK